MANTNFIYEEDVIYKEDMKYIVKKNLIIIAYKSFLN
jgi:hypothetical protein